MIWQITPQLRLQGVFHGCACTSCKCKTCRALKVHGKVFTLVAMLAVQKCNTDANRVGGNYSMIRRSSIQVITLPRNPMAAPMGQLVHVPVGNGHFPVGVSIVLIGQLGISDGYSAAHGKYIVS